MYVVVLKEQKADDALTISASDQCPEPRDSLPC